MIDKLFIELLNSIDKEKVTFEGYQGETEDVLGFYSWYLLCGKDSKKLPSVWLNLKKRGMETSDFRLKNLIYFWTQIPFHYNKIPIDVYNFIKECSKLLVLPDRIDNLSELINSKRSERLN